MPKPINDNGNDSNLSSNLKAALEAVSRMNEKKKEIESLRDKHLMLWMMQSLQLLTDEVVQYFSGETNDRSGIFLAAQNAKTCVERAKASLN